MKSKFKNDKGITLVALVITIIVLLILAGVTIGTLTGDNSIIQRAIEAKHLTKYAQIKENVAQKILEIEGGKTLNWNNLTVDEKKEQILQELNKNHMVDRDVKIVENLVIVADKYVLSLSTGDDAIKADDSWNYVTEPQGYTRNESSGFGVIDEHVVNEEGVDGKVAAIIGYNGTDTNLTIPEYVIDNNIIYPVTRISNKWNAETNLNNNTNIESIKFMDNIKIIEPWCFQRDNNLTKVSMGNGVELIGVGAFAWCGNLSTVEISEKLTEIPEQCFISCNSLNVINVPSKVTRIGKLAFGYVGYADPDTGLGYGVNTEPKLEKIILKEGLKYIGEEAFTSAYSVKQDLYLPSTIEQIDNNAFLNYGLKITKDENGNQQHDKKYNVYKSDGTQIY